MRCGISPQGAERLKASQIDLFGKVLINKLPGKDSPMAKSYLNTLASEIVVEDKTARSSGS